MKKIRGFKCTQCNTTFERMVTDDVLTINCECHGLANRTLSAPKVLGNTCGKSPSLSNKRF